MSDTVTRDNGSPPRGKYKGVDFTWHSTVAYALGFGVTLYVYQKRKGRVSTSQFDSMKNELKGWMSLMAYADLVLRTRNHLQHIFEPRVRRLEAEYEGFLQRTSSERTQQAISTPTSSTISSRAFIKPDPSPRPSPLSTVSNSMEIRPGPAQQEIPSIHYPHAQAVSNNQDWPHPTHYTAQAGNVTPTYTTQTTSGTPTYIAYTTGAQQYTTLPTSLAPLLNDQTSGYMTYPSPGTNQQNEMMMFQPGHYTDSPATMMWPMITMPPQDHGQQHGPNTNMKFN